jgi:hypothetical protein
VSLFVGAGEANAAIKGGSIAGKAAKVASKAEKVAGAANVAGKTAEVTNVASKAEKVTEAANLADKTADAGTLVKGGDEVAKAEQATLKAGNQKPKTATTTPKAETPKTEADVSKTERGRTEEPKREQLREKKPLLGEQERGESSNSGYQYAEEVLPGGTGRAFAGHGAFRYGTNPKAFTVPEGTALSIWSKPDTKIPDRLGRLIETGDYDKLADLFTRDPVAQDRLTGARIYLPGSNKIPNYTLSAPKDLKIHKNSITVEDPRTLSELVKPNSGHLDWAACTEFPNMGR